MATGIIKKHERACPQADDRDARCTCTRVSYQGWVWDRRSGKKRYKTFAGKDALAAAKGWRRDAERDLEQGPLRSVPKVTLRDAADSWLVGAKAEPPTVLNRNGRPYKPSVLRGYEADLERYVLEELGAAPLGEIRRGDLQALVDRLVGRGLSASKVRNIVVSVRVVYRHAVEREQVAVNPTNNVRLPNGDEQRDRAASATEAAALLAALPETERPLWATAFYAGLRRGELRGLRWEDVDLAAGLIHVRRGWDDVAGEIAPKSAKGARSVPVTAVLRDYLTEQKARTGGDGVGLVFGATAERPFVPNTVRRRAAAAWAKENKRRKKAKLEPLVPIGLHECRHTFVSILFDAGLPLERIGDYVGHSSAYMTDRYRHLLAGHEAETARLLDAYLERADTQARLAQVEA